MNVSTYLAKQYPAPPCWALVADVYATELGQGVEDYKTVTPGIRAIARAFRLALHKSAHGFHQVAEPIDFAVVLLSRSPVLDLHHCGIAYGGKVLHASSDGNRYQDLASLRDAYPIMEFWSKAAAE